MIYITRKERFNAAHRLFRPEWSDEKNREVFGKCSNPLWHGHNYTLYVTVKGAVNPETGFLINLSHLSEIINQVIIEKVDHRNLNLEVDFMKGQLVSTENLAKAFWEQLKPPVRDLGAELHCIKVIETENNYVEYFGY
ncbi:MAG: 6-carboxytetrahydropterin synthase [Bacteroidales bacterium]|nr:6-carboxytetrahydropterin synthase [Bacteroidales bacterium]